MEGLARLMRANEAVLLAGKLRCRSEAEGGLSGFIRLAQRYEAQARALLVGRAATGVPQTVAANQNEAGAPFVVEAMRNAPALTATQRATQQ